MSQLKIKRIVNYINLATYLYIKKLKNLTNINILNI